VLTLGFHVVPGRTDEVAECLRRIKSIKTITLTAGRYDMLSYAVLRSHQELPSFLYQELGQIPYLVRTETMLVLDAVKASWKYLSQDIQRFRKTTHSDIDGLDFELIKELELCPRESIRTLGKKLGVNRNLVGKRLNSLLDNGIIRVVSPISEPSILGFNLDVTILVRAQLGKVMGVANSLIHETRVRHVATTNGPFELYLRAAFRDAEEMSDFLTKRLGSHEGVTSYETLIHLKTIQESYSLL
jgi:DNA-binding Lrp family transcriptional regulator